jgi:hypothetical protein
MLILILAYSLVLKQMVHTHTTYIMYNNVYGYKLNVLNKIY